ncbi:MAG: DUF4105 domain-containing protein [Muribaculum sp.]|nr:DUF4105 domain-containing protein [Muribaculaceae bacterium]MCM1080608.1 DUF4105 domain-containing protein [Muribaculum sp.]
MELLRNTILYSLLSLSVLANAQSDSVEVSLLICSPGQEVYELEGHAGIRLRNKSAGYDVVVNYGLFDFQSPNFIYRFVKGETDYMVGATDFSNFCPLYLAENRSVTEWPLDLTAEEANRLVALVATNLRPENRTYRYNYVLDNCSTRPLEMIERAVGRKVDFVDPGVSDGWSFRRAMEYYHRNYPWYQFGIDLALGSGIDYTISAREKAFAPVLLNEMMADAKFEGGDRRLAKGDAIVHLPDKLFKPEESRPLAVTPLRLGIAIFVLSVAVACVDIRRRKVSCWVDAVLMGIYGLTGCVLAFLVFVSTHEATSPNMLLLWLNPFCLIVPALIYIKRYSSFVLKYEIVNFVLLLTMAIAWPLFGQRGNIAFVPMIAADAVLSARYIFIALCDKRRIVF